MEYNLELFSTQDDDYFEGVVEVVKTVTECSTCTHNLV